MAKQSYTHFTHFDLFKLQSLSPGPQHFPSFLSNFAKNYNKTNLVAPKRLCVSSSLQGFRYLEESKDVKRGDSLVPCKAYEAHQVKPIQINIEFAEEVREVAAQKLKIGVYFATWWALNVIFNIYNKKVLNAFPFPWLTSTLSLAVGSLMMFVSWATKIAQPPKTDLNFWKALLPVSI